ncbi:hypothetical protein BS47DRAFT_1343049 [Hydnum rufescens UP504]|uniref:Uncharacterized protein n=1 Tax=Hydnum rufescens UP504 TaxID=1448309 RepID=A0A9P6AZ18_9AGAM|nr:hypothetical protein BS47DRAFT_1343049 [Hydnum rufescens UP504]
MPRASCSPIPSRGGAISSRHTNFQSGRAYLGSDRFRCISSGVDWWPDSPSELRNLVCRSWSPKIE